MSTEEYSNYIKNKSLNELQEIANHIDKIKFPERVRLIDELIIKKLASQSQFDKQILSRNKAFTHISIIRNFYLFLLMVGSFALFWRYEKYSDQTVYFLIGFIIVTTIIYGLYRIKSWVVILILIAAYGQLISSLFYMPATVIGLFLKVLIVAFSLYQIYIFSRKETRLFFKEKGPTILSI